MNLCRLPLLLTAITSISLFATGLLSCSQLGQGKRIEEEEETLRTISETRDNLVPWTDELERDRLTTPIHSTDGIEKRVVLSPLAVLAGGAEKTVAPVYPFQEGLGLLDYAAFPEQAQTVLDAFCEAFTTDAKTEQYVAAQSLYLLALFYHDVKERIEPLKELEPEPHEQKTKKTSETQQESESEAQPDDENEKPSPADFTSYRYASPFVTADFLQVPVQFTGSYATMTTSIFLIREKDAWKIDQIHIRKWENQKQ